MLKRHQVLLTEWLAEYIWYIAEKYDLSFSEVIRMMLSIQFLRMIIEISPHYKSSVKQKEMIKTIKHITSHKMDEEIMHRLLSKLYFEARKAVEFRLTELGKQK